MPFTAPAELHNEFAEAMQAHELDTLADMYEDHAIQLEQDSTVISGPSQIRGMFEALLEGFTPSGGTQRLALVADDLSLTSTVYSFPTADGTGSTTMLTCEVSRRQPDGTWRVVIDVPTFATYAA